MVCTFFLLQLIDDPKWVEQATINRICFIPKKNRMYVELTLTDRHLVATRHTPCYFIFFIFSFILFLFSRMKVNNSVHSFVPTTH